MEEDQPVTDDLVALVDALFIEFFPCAPRLLELLEERGYTGWTNIRQTDSAILSECSADAAWPGGGEPDVMAVAIG